MAQPSLETALLKQFAQKTPHVSRLPNWLGNAQSVIGVIPPYRVRPLIEGFLFGDWERAWADVAQIRFEIYEPGITDRDYEGLNEFFQVRIQYRFLTGEAFRSDVVSVAGRTRSTAIYAIDLRSFDPWNASDGTHAPGMQRMELYFTVNGVEFRPPGGRSFEGVFLMRS